MQLIFTDLICVDQFNQSDQRSIFKQDNMTGSLCGRVTKWQQDDVFFIWNKN